MVYGLNDTMAHDSVFLESYAKFYSLFNPGTDFHNPRALLTPLAITPNNVELVRMLNVDYVFHKEDVTGTKIDSSSFDSNLLEYVRKEGGRHILRLKNPLPRAFFVERTKIIPESEVMAQMGSGNFNAKSVSYLSDDLDVEKDSALLPPVFGAKDKVEYQPAGPNSFVLNYSSESKMRPVFISNVFYPGWKAVTSEGKELQIHKVNLAFMLVFVPPSKNGKIIFSYSPSHFLIYLSISLISFLGLITILIFSDKLSARVKDHLRI